MRNRTPVPASERPPLPDFTPVPRKYRHDGWTPERQKAFIEALSDCGSVTRAAAQVNMAQANCYALRRAAGAEEFRRAWDAALDFGLKRLKDIAFERAIEGQLVPVFVAGKLMGFRRKRNDALLMFCLRHYGQDGDGRRTTINYFSTRASAGAGAGAVSEEKGSPSTSSGRAVVGMAGAGAEASTTTVRTVITGAPRGGGGSAALDGAAEVVNGSAGVKLDAEAEAAIAAALEACAARSRVDSAAFELGGPAAEDALADDPGAAFVHSPCGWDFRGELEPPDFGEEYVQFGGDEGSWRQAGAEMAPALARLLDEEKDRVAGGADRDEAKALPAPARKRRGKKQAEAGSSPG